MPKKIVKRFYLKCFIGCVFSTGLCLYSIAQSDTALQVINKYKVYRQQIRNDAGRRMIELKSVIPPIQYDLRYATTNNFTHHQLYKKGNKTYIRLPVAKALLKVQQELDSKGYGLKIFDAYRPYNVTKKMWELVKDERYVANPAKGSGHNRGIAVDLTIIILKTVEELNMGTGFDNFTDSAHHDFFKLSSEILQNRKLLKETMEKYGFKSFDTEWWHYSWPNDKGYEVLDLDFKQLGRNFKQRY